MREDIELATHKLYFSRHDRVVADANHENVSSYSLGGGLAFTFRDFISGLVLALLLLRRFAGRCPLLREPPPPRNFLIIFCVVSVTCFYRLSPVSGIGGYIGHDFCAGAQSFASDSLGTAPQYRSHGPP